MVADNEPLSGAQIDEQGLEQLVNTIRLGIVIKGFYLLYDERLDLICGRRKEMDSSQWAAAVQDFAKQHGWKARLNEEAGAPVEFLLGR